MTKEEREEYQRQMKEAREQLDRLRQGSSSRGGVAPSKTPASPR